jgi:hypothetical protein
MSAEGVALEIGSGFVSASFKSFSAADKKAQKHGWQVKNEAGETDHRCPECIGKPFQPSSLYADAQGRGAYVRIRKGQVV